MRVSVVIPTYNSGPLVVEAVLMAQISASHSSIAARQLRSWRGGWTVRRTTQQSRGVTTVRPHRTLSDPLELRQPGNDGTRVDYVAAALNSCRRRWPHWSCREEIEGTTIRFALLIRTAKSRPCGFICNPEGGMDRRASPRLERTKGGGRR